MYNFWSGIWILQNLEIKFIKYSNCAKSNISQECFLKNRYLAPQILQYLDLKFETRIFQKI
jgi:hypothetical protein